MNTYGERLDHALLLARKSRSSLGRELKISPQAIGQVILGKTRALTAENSARAARFLGVDHLWLATGEGRPELANVDTLWPFPHISPDIYAQLSDAQRAGIEDWVMGQIDAYLPISPNKSRSKVTASNA